MIPFNELKIGDYVKCTFEGKQWEGEITDLNHDEKQVCVLTEVQEFWYDPQALDPLPLNDEQLQKLCFKKEKLPDGSIKYSKGAFRILIPAEGDFSAIDLWYREDRRYHPNVHYIHQLQNHYTDMTKIHLTTDPM
ncbi:MAG: hypothetical protein KGK14_07795 [Bacteroidota bacterium]|jgi:hypothetical protein|nr:hypothetical protein [Bacteroidota bacterium]